MGAPKEYRQRYIAFKTEERPPKEEIENMLSNLNQELEFSPKSWLILYSQEYGEGLIKCSNLQVDRLKEKMESREKINISIKGVSGTIKKAKQKFLSS